ncbi:MAG: hypothetical protein PHU42_03705 [Patescibacteria group bacterium]|nr:hypothetical protein [Patescibacteria group bacterium]
MANFLVSKYKLKMFAYRVRGLAREIIGKRGERKRARIFSAFAILAIVILIASISVYGLGLKSTAEGGTQISAATSLTYDGVSIHAKAARIIGGVSDYSATAKKGANDTIRFTLTVSNANTATPTTSTDVKFTLPSGFTFLNMVTTPAGLPAKTGPDTNGVILWSGYNAPVGESTIVFDTKAP